MHRAINVINISSNTLLNWMGEKKNCKFSYWSRHLNTVLYKCTWDMQKTFDLEAFLFLHLLVALREALLSVAIALHCSLINQQCCLIAIVCKPIVSSHLRKRSIGVGFVVVEMLYIRFSNMPDFAYNHTCVVCVCICARQKKQIISNYSIEFTTSELH